MSARDPGEVAADREHLKRLKDLLRQVGSSRQRSMVRDAIRSVTGRLRK